MAAGPLDAGGLPVIFIDALMVTIRITDGVRQDRRP
jgi:hypothetical protein